MKRGDRKRPAGEELDGGDKRPRGAQGAPSRGGGAGALVDFSNAFAVPDVELGLARKPEQGALPRSRAGFLVAPYTSDLDEGQRAKRTAQRQKQVDFGKNTIGYARYIEAVQRREPASDCEHMF